MTRLSNNLTIGTRNSRLSRIQTEHAVGKLCRILPGLSFHIAPYESPGDRDRKVDLRTTPPDIFTRDLDHAVKTAEIDCALHSAKDLPDPMPEGLDWVWLPWREDPRDVIVTRKGMAKDDLPETPVAGISSRRREEYCRANFSQATIRPVRGNIENRIAQLDAGQYDMLILAAAGLIRLGLRNRIAEYIPLEQLPPPDGQGALALTFRAEDRRMLAIRSLFVHSVVIAGGGPGGKSLCTTGAADALRRCDVCFYDGLIDRELLDWLPDTARGISVSKRAGTDGCSQKEICNWLTTRARRGMRVVRLKGGDPGIFGRLAEEVSALDKLGLPYRVIPGVSSHLAATTGTGLTLTRRKCVRGFSVMTPAGAGGSTVPVDSQARARLPSLCLYMGLKRLPQVQDELIGDGLNPHTPCAVVYNAGRENQQVVCGDLRNITSRLQQSCGPDTGATHKNNSGERIAGEAPGLILIGDNARQMYLYKSHGPLANHRILLTCSAAVMPEAVNTVQALGGRPVVRSLVACEPEPAATAVVRHIHEYDAVLLTSPSAVDILLSIVRQNQIDIRNIPHIFVYGKRTASRLERANLRARNAQSLEDATSGWDTIVQAVNSLLTPGASVLRLRSNQAGEHVANDLRNHGFQVTDAVLYRTVPVRYADMPDHDAVIFTSGSTVRAFLENWGQKALAATTTAVIGRPTAAALQSSGIVPDVIAPEMSVAATIHVLAGWYVTRQIMCRKGQEPLAPD